MSGTPSIHYHRADPYRRPFWTRYVPPPAPPDSASEKDARWVIVPHYALLSPGAPDRYAVQTLCNRYGKERLVVFDASDQGRGDYPCRAFGQNVTHQFPSSVQLYLEPCLLRHEHLDGNLYEITSPVRERLAYAVTFVGDGISHPCRKIGVERLRSSTLVSCTKLNDDGWSVKLRQPDNVYAESFNTRLMWCPPSRRPVTWRFCESLRAGIPIITGAEVAAVLQNTPFAYALGACVLHNADASDLVAVVERALANTELAVAALRVQAEFKTYGDNFWNWVSRSLQ